MTFAPVSQQEGLELMKAADIGELTQTTPANTALSQIKPNVALFIMESMGFNMMSYDKEGEVDLLGALRRILNRISFFVDLHRQIFIPFNRSRNCFF